MIPAGVQVFVALDSVDMRCGFDRLAAMVRERMGYEPRSGALFVFVGRRRQLVKILFADATGTCVFAKRLDKGVVLTSCVARGGCDARRSRRIHARCTARRSRSHAVDRDVCATRLADPACTDTSRARETSHYPWTAIASVHTDDARAGRARARKPPTTTKASSRRPTS